jgi:hypothetical protein
VSGETKRKNQLEIDWLKKINGMLLETDWLNILVDRGINKFTSFNLAKYDFALFFGGDANVINSR